MYRICISHYHQKTKLVFDTQSPVQSVLRTGEKEIPDEPRKAYPLSLLRKRLHPPTVGERHPKALQLKTSYTTHLEKS